MKNLKNSIAFLFAITIFVSCENDSSNQNLTAENENAKKSIEEIAIESNKLMQNDLKFFFKDQKFTAINNDDPILDNEKNITKMISKISNENNNLGKYQAPPPIIYGPFSVTLTDNLIYSDRLVILANVPSYSTGTYQCRVYRFSTTILLQNNTTGWIKPGSFTNQCYSNYTNQTIGYNYNVTVNQNGQTLLNLNTYYLRVDGNILGQWLGGYSIPNSSTPNPTLQYLYMPI